MLDVSNFSRQKLQLCKLDVNFLQGSKDQTLKPDLNKFFQFFYSPVKKESKTLQVTYAASMTTQENKLKVKVKEEIIEKQSPSETYRTDDILVISFHI